ncbi:MAG: hypothetical protein V1820_01350 [archaeon]
MAVKTFNITEQIYRDFRDFCKENGFSMSKQVEIFMRAQLEEKEIVREGFLRTLERLRKGKFVKVKNLDEIL